MISIYRSVLKNGIVPYGTKQITVSSLNTVTEDVSTYDQVEISVSGLYENPEQLVVPTGNKEITITEAGTISNIDVKEYETASVTTEGLAKVSGTRTINLDDAVTLVEDVTNYETVRIVPQGLAKPSGTINITKNGSFDVTNKVSANVSVMGPNIIELLDWDNKIQLTNGLNYITSKKGILWGNNTRPYSEDGESTAEISINNRTILKVDIYSNNDIYSRVDFNGLSVKANTTIRCVNLTGDGSGTPYFIPYINQNIKALDWSNNSKYNATPVSYENPSFTAPYDGYIGIMNDATDCNFTVSPYLKVNDNIVHYGKGSYIVPYWIPVRKDDVCEICDENGESINEIEGHVCFVGFED